jgi:hypothetical protein
VQPASDGGLNLFLGLGFLMDPPQPSAPEQSLAGNAQPAEANGQQVAAIVSKGGPARVGVAGELPARHCVTAALSNVWGYE